MEIISAKSFPSKFNSSDCEVIFGGSFDPIHQGHIEDIKTLIKLLNKVYLAPTEKNPWKENKPAPLINRLEMIELTLIYEKIDFLRYNEYSNESNNISKSDSGNLLIIEEPYIYAYEVVRRIKKITNKNLFWAIGEDLIKDVSSWKNWDSEGISVIALPLVQGKSSTKTRNKEIPPHPAITDYIIEKNLYL